MAWRFGVVYFGLYAIATPLVRSVLVLPAVAAPPLGMVWPLRDLTLWVAQHVFGLTAPFIYTGNSGDTAFHWVQTALVGVFATVATALWWRLDPGSARGARLYPWARLGLRLVLAAQMIEYGMAKVIPTQFPAPSLVTLVQPVGQLALSDLLWTFMGASTSYQVFTGLVELVAGVLLLWPATATLGAALALVATTQVFALNMAYDVGLKQIAGHLVLMALFLLAPALGCVGSTLGLLPGSRPPFVEPALFRSSTGNRRAALAQAAFGLYLLGIFTLAGSRYWQGEGGGGAPKSPLYGIWDVATLTVDGRAQPVELNDYDRRWKRVIFDGPALVVFQRTDDSFARYGVTVDESNQRLALTKGSSRTWQSGFAYQLRAPDVLSLTGEMDGHTIAVELRRVDSDTFRLLNSRFRWVRPPDPFAG